LSSIQPISASIHNNNSFSTGAIVPSGGGGGVGLQTSSLSMQAIPSSSPTLPSHQVGPHRGTSGSLASKSSGVGRINSQTGDSLQSLGTTAATNYLNNSDGYHAKSDSTGGIDGSNSALGNSFGGKPGQKSAAFPQSMDNMLATVSPSGKTPYIY
jgi:hypothetical protein